MIPRTLPNGSTTEAVTKSFPTLARFVVRRRTQAQQLLERSGNVVDMPVGDLTGRTVGRTVRREAAVDDAQLVLIVADPELDVLGRPLLRAGEIWLDPENVRVPGCRLRHVLGEVADRRETSQHRLIPFWRCGHGLSGLMTSILLNMLTE